MHLLRKKLEPDIESWVEEARETAREAGLDASKLSGGRLGGRAGDGYGEDEDGDDYGLDQEGEVPSDPFNEQWADIRDACYDGIKFYIETQAREPYTVSEQERGPKNIRTGLRRSLEDESDEEEDDEEEDEDEDTGAAIKTGSVARAPGSVTSAGMGGPAKVPGLQPEHILWFAARGDLNMPPNIELEVQRRVKDTAKRPIPGR